MNLRKLGCIFGVDQFKSFSTHAQAPTAIELEDCVRVYFAARDAQNKSFTAFADFDRDDPRKLIRVSSEPVLSRAQPGAFDEDGVMPSQVLKDKDRILLFYTGWNKKTSTPYHNSIGLAQSFDQGLTFQRVCDGPIMDRTPEEPYIAVTPSVLKEGNVFLCWYSSGTRWILVGGKYEPIYVIKTATSEDGIHWVRRPQQCIPWIYEDEVCSSPSVFKRGHLCHMLFCTRGVDDYRDGARSYRLGYATSSDGTSWERNDKRLQFEGPNADWDLKMNCYPYYVSINGQDYVLYNGNGFGQTGFGLARIEF